jgi:predicted nucleotidyltransferase
MVHGSCLYGTNTPASDRDFKAVYLPESRDMLLGRVKRSFNFNTKHEREKAVNGITAKNIAEDIDMEVLTLAHFFNMLEDGDPMALDMLFVNEGNILENSRIWKEIQHNTHRLICTKISRSLGYCYS